MTNFFNMKKLSEKYHVILSHLTTLPPPPAQTRKDISQWDATLQIPAYIRRAHKK